MEILTSNGFRKFYGFKEKKANCVKITYIDNNNSNNEEYCLECSDDHLLKLNTGIWQAAKLFDIGSIIVGDKKEYKITAIESIGEKTVYTPVNVEGKEYIADRLDSHNCSFAGSSDTLISGDCLDSLTSKEPIGYQYGYDMNIYEEYVDGGLYIMGVDSAMGNAGDYSAVQVIRILGKNDYRQVATYRRNTIRAEDFAEVVHAISEMYGGALYIIENNDIGRTVADTLYYEIGDPNMISTDSRGNLGTRADRMTKIDACRLLKTMVEKKHLKLVDAATIDELARFEQVGTTWKAAAGAHDDLVSSLYWACYCISQPEVDLDGMKIDMSKAADSALPPPMYADFGMGGMSNPYGVGMSEADFWKGMN